jgi:rRNA maturation RNase YbeY
MALRELPNLTIVRKNGPIPVVPFLRMKEAILGKNYVLTIVFGSKEEIRTRNKEYRNKDYTTNVLSFPLSKNEGEIYMSLFKVRQDAKEFGMSYQEFLYFLTIHGLLHLKGYDHSSTMEKLEENFLRQFFRGTKNKGNDSGNRHRKR